MAIISVYSHVLNHWFDVKEDSFDYYSSDSVRDQDNEYPCITPKYVENIPNLGEYFYIITATTKDDEYIPISIVDGENYDIDELVAAELVQHYNFTPPLKKLKETSEELSNEEDLEEAIKETIELQTNISDQFKEIDKKIDDSLSLIDKINNELNAESKTSIKLISYLPNI